MQVRAACVLSAFLLLAGCTGGNGDGAAPSPATASATGFALPPGLNVTEDGGLAPPPTPLEVSGCIMHAHNVPVPAEQATAHLPPGFSPVPYQGAPTPTVNTVLFVSVCDSTAGAANLTGVAEAMIYIGVVPPDELQRADHGYRLVLVHATASPELAAAYARWNITLDEADIEVAGLVAGPAGAPEDRVAGAFGLTTRSQVAAQGPALGVPLRYFYAREGELVGIVDRQLEDTLTNLVGPMSYELSEAPLGNGPGAGYTAVYDWSDRLAYTATPVPLVT